MSPFSMEYNISTANQTIVSWRPKRWFRWSRHSVRLLLPVYKLSLIKLMDRPIISQYSEEEDLHLPIPGCLLWPGHRVYLNVHMLRVDMPSSKYYH